MPNNNLTQQLEASFSILVMSIASNAMLALGLSPHPETGQTEVDKNLAKFNIDLLVVLSDKTKGQLSSEENELLTNIIQDLQMKFVHGK